MVVGTTQYVIRIASCCFALMMNCLLKLNSELLGWVLVNEELILKGFLSENLQAVVFAPFEIGPGCREEWRLEIPLQGIFLVLAQQLIWKPG